MVGARAARVALAFSASTFLTAVVALPMAYQAHSARNSTDATTLTTEVPASVLGRSTVPTTFTTGTSFSATTTTTTSTTSTTTPAGAVSTTTRPTTGAGRSATTTTTPWFVSPTPPSVPSTVPGAPGTTAPPVSTTVAPTTTTEPQLGSTGLYFSTSFLLVPAEPLDGAQLVPTVFVFLDLPDIVKVDFSLDGKPTATEFAPPWELFGGRALEPGALGIGTHTVRADITFADGRTDARAAVFAVVVSE